MSFSRDHAVVRVGEVHAFFDFGAVNFDEHLTDHFVGELGKVLAGEGAVELTLKCLLEPRY
jgi:hypothetical protein